jgi:hypothetical protein
MHDQAAEARSEWFLQGREGLDGWWLVQMGNATGRLEIWCRCLLLPRGRTALGGEPKQAIRLSFKLHSDAENSIKSDGPLPRPVTVSGAPALPCPLTFVLPSLPSIPSSSPCSLTAHCHPLPSHDANKDFSCHPSTDGGQLRDQYTWSCRQPCQTGFISRPALRQRLHRPGMGPPCTLFALNQSLGPNICVSY